MMFRSLRFARDTILAWVCVHLTAPMTMMTPLTTTFAWETCPGTTHVLCPNENLCCLGRVHTDAVCLSGIRGSAAYSTCCKDDHHRFHPTVTATGCGAGFVCAVSRTNDHRHSPTGGRIEPDATGGTSSGFKKRKQQQQQQQHYPICRATDPEWDELPTIVPRNKLCRVTPNMTLTFGLPMTTSMATSLGVTRDTNNNDFHSSPVAAYLSTHGAIHEPNVIFHEVEQAIVLVHGSSRNVEDYICCTSAALLSTTTDNGVLLVAPWFLAPSDGPVNFTATVSQQEPQILEPLRWIDLHDDRNGTDDRSQQEHTWRYGASSIGTKDSTTTDTTVFSSLDVIDTLVRTLSNRSRFPNLRQIVVTGHSAGGQLVQRWALISPFMPGTTTALMNDDSIPIRTVVANPKSYAYLDARRWIAKDNTGTTATTSTEEQLVFAVPSQAAVEHCPTYNQWLWGLEPSTVLFDIPYVKAILAATNASALVERYATRRVIYLSGDQDVLLNGQCEAQFQGPNRYIRSQRYFASLAEIYGGKHVYHQRWVVPNVHHDHCLMYQSEPGQRALLGGPEIDIDFSSATRVMMM